MLVIRRRPGESVILAEDIEVEILDLTQSHVKLGIRAPKSVRILRKEVRLAGDHNREAAGLGSLESLTSVVNILRAEDEFTSNKLSDGPISGL